MEEDGSFNVCKPRGIDPKSLGYHDVQTDTDGRHYWTGI